ncbi:MAG TPA: hypothetical protein GX008_02215 [Firmicutes bacterium]|nr:MAG: hypothetical protein AA931_03050 [Peptococcaceae bacterium 1109]HHT72510.1 hypothetical protein [Bacillota bacterium]
MSILAVVPQAASLKLAVGSEHDARLSELPLSDLTPQHVFQLTTAALDALSFPKPLLQAVALGSDLPACRGFLQELAQLFRVGLGLPAVVISKEHYTEFLAESRLTGFSAFQRAQQGPALAVWHAAERAREELAFPVGEGRFVVAYIGDAVVTGAVQGGKIIDLSTPYDEGPFSVTTSGSLPFAQLLAFCQDVGSREEAIREVTERSGFRGYLGVGSLAEADALAWTKHEADWIYTAFVYQLAKEICAYAAVLRGKHDAVVLTGPYLTPNGLRGLSAYLGGAAILNYPGDHSVHAVLRLGQRLMESGKELEVNGIY